MKQEPLKIIYRTYGIADRFSDGTVELNIALNDYPELKAAILKHELHHTDNPRFNKKDLLHDINTPDQVKFMHMLKFMLRHPKSLTQFAPLYWTKKRGWIVDWNLVVIYSVVTVIAGSFAIAALVI